eukprot:scaffold47024_cov33-Phaeocystis_antarctica.AAC.2
MANCTMAPLIVAYGAPVMKDPKATCPRGRVRVRVRVRVGVRVEALDPVDALHRRQLTRRAAPRRARLTGAAAGGRAFLTRRRSVGGGRGSGG